MRAHFSGQDFIEAETAILQVSPGNETHLHAFATEICAPGGARTQLYLHTSPEFACKKLLAAGEQRLVTFAKVFRNRERGALHAPEFTMLEWYRARAPYAAVMQDCADILQLAAEAAGSRALRWRGRQADAFAAPERLSVADAFTRYAGMDLMATLTPQGAPVLAPMLRAARELNIRVAQGDTWSDIFSRILCEKIEPNLGLGHAVILDQYPLCEAALARPCAHDPRLAERFELYACGVELANAFGELTDAVEQRRRFDLAMAEKSRIYGETYPIDEDFLAALAHMPPASGAALGLDRLVMLATGANRIDDVQWTPVAGAG